MFFFCECLNVSGEISEHGAVINGFTTNSTSAVSDVACFEALEFLKSATPAKGIIAVQYEALVQQQKVDKWNVKHCLNCDTFVYATAEGISEDMMLLNPSLIRDHAQFLALQNYDKYSVPFKIILKPIDGLPRPLQMSINDDARIKLLYKKLQNFLETDAAHTQAEIGRLTIEMNARRQKAQKDFERIATLIESTKTMSTDDIELTPPVTPESINEKSMDNQLQGLPQAKKIGSRGSDKHANAISPPQQVRTIDFDEDIFEFDGMHDNHPKNEADEKYSDSEEGSDGEQAVDKRGYNRGRSGSINIARSAPISMPQFIHHAIHEIDTEERPTVEQQMDIASSIQMLARSIHADSIFGEMPRPVLRYNTEF